jgi:hypothetical protein
MKSVIHLYLYGMIKRHAKGRVLIHISEINPIIKWTVKLPHKYAPEILRELVELGFLKRLKHDAYEIIPLNVNPLCDSLGEPLWN